MSQDHESRLIIRAALMLQSSLVLAHDFQLPDAELQPYIFNVLIYDLNTALDRGVYHEVIATINVR